MGATRRQALAVLSSLPRDGQAAGRARWRVALRSRRPAASERRHERDGLAAPGRRPAGAGKRAERGEGGRKGVRAAGKLWADAGRRALTRQAVAAAPASTRPTSGAPSAAKSAPQSARSRRRPGRGAQAGSRRRSELMRASFAGGTADPSLGARSADSGKPPRLDVVDESTYAGAAQIRPDRTRGTSARASPPGRSRRGRLRLRVSGAPASPTAACTSSSLPAAIRQPVCATTIARSTPSR